MYSFHLLHENKCLTYVNTYISYTTCETRFAVEKKIYQSEGILPRYTLTRSYFYFHFHVSVRRARFMNGSAIGQRLTPIDFFLPSRPENSSRKMSSANTENKIYRETREYYYTARAETIDHFCETLTSAEIYMYS